jgi:CubicO group peptidase (beta-lactamase class C family)
MKKRFALCLVILQIALLLPRSVIALTQPSADSLSARLDSLIVPLIKPGGPGCSIAVIRDGAIVFERGYGLANMDWGIPNTPATVFNIASLSKQFTAACILLLAEDGKLSLDDDIRTWLPELPDYGKKITIRHLINHTSGIRDYESLMTAAGMRYDFSWEPREIYDFIVRQKELDFAPGEKHSYSNSGYVLLAEIVRKASGLSLARFADLRIFKPLGMQHTFYYDTLYQTVKNRAMGYDYDFDRLIYTMGQCDTYTVGPGGVFTTVEDLTLWDGNFYMNKVGGPRFIESMLTVGVLNDGKSTNYACGLETGEYRGLPTFSHSGWWAGYLSHMLRFPEQKTTIILLANSTSDVLPFLYCQKIADLYLYDRFPPDKRPELEKKSAPQAVRTEAAVAPAIFDRYTGMYQIGKMDAVFTVSRDGERLMGMFSGQFRFRLYAESDSTFFLKIDDAQVKFRRDGSGKVNRLVWCQGGGEMTFDRIVSHDTAEALDAYRGDYHSEDLRAEWSIVPEEGFLKVRSPLRSTELTGNDLLLRKEGDRFCLSNMNLLFKRDDKGNVAGFDLNRGGATWTVRFFRK